MPGHWGLRVYKSFVLAGIASAFLAGAASASSVTLNYEGASVGSDKGYATVTSSPVGVTGTFGAFGFNMSSPDIVDDFVAWCLDLTNTLKGTSQYELTDTPFVPFSINEANVQKVFDANFGGVDVTDKVEAAAFQLALWEAGYDGFSLSSGAFQGTGASSSATSITATAQAYLDAAFSYAGNKAYELSFFQSVNAEGPQSQSLVTASEVPLPAAAWLLIGGVAALGAIGRRKTA